MEPVTDAVTSTDMDDDANSWEPKHYVKLHVYGKTPQAAEHAWDEEFIDPKDAARISGFHVNVIYRAIDDRELIAYKLRNRCKIRRPDFDAWAEMGRVEPSIHDI